MAWPDWLELVASAAPPAVSWPAVGATLAPLVLMGVFRLLSERQRRTTLVALMRHAPEGTVVIHHRGPDGLPMWILLIWIGDGRHPPVVPPVLVLRDGVIAAVLLGSDGRD
jgi:hypothetical protein